MTKSEKLVERLSKASTKAETLVLIIGYLRERNDMCKRLQKSFREIGDTEMEHGYFEASLELSDLSDGLEQALFDFPEDDYED